MNFPYINKGLLWKEWKQNRGTFLVTLLILTYAPLIRPLIRWLNQEENLKVVYPTPDTMQFIYSGSMATIAILAVIITGIILLGAERKGSINYLVTTPVSRKEIILAKYITGAAIITGIMFINTLGILLARHFFPAIYTYTNIESSQIFTWVLLFTAAFFCLFSLAFLVSTISGNVLAAGIITFIFIILPNMLISLVSFIAYKFFDASQAFAIKASTLINYLTLTNYITGDNDKITSVHYNDNSIIYGVASSGHNTYNYPLEIIGLLAASLIFLFLAVKIFERNPLERKGELLLFGNFKHAGQIIIALIYGTSKALPTAQSFLSFLGYFIMYFLIVYIIIAIIFRILLCFGIGKPATEVHQE